MPGGARPFPTSRVFSFNSSPKITQQGLVSGRGLFGDRGESNSVQDILKNQSLYWPQSPPVAFFKTVCLSSESLALLWLWTGKSAGPSVFYSKCEYNILISTQPDLKIGLLYTGVGVRGEGGEKKKKERTWQTNNRGRGLWWSAFLWMQQMELKPEGGPGTLSRDLWPSESLGDSPRCTFGLSASFSSL